jgi:hypothetical protein
MYGMDNRECQNATEHEISRFSMTYKLNYRKARFPVVFKTVEFF